MMKLGQIIKVSNTEQFYVEPDIEADGEDYDLYKNEIRKMEKTKWTIEEVLPTLLHSVSCLNSNPCCRTMYCVEQWQSMRARTGS